MPFRQFILKVHSRCDLACDHCYVYEHADQSWRGAPEGDLAGSGGPGGRADRRACARASADRRAGCPARRRAAARGCGEARRIAAALRAAIEPTCALDLRIHTNGVQLDEEFCELFLAQRIKVGVSLDGDRKANDLHRNFADGRSSFDQAVRAINLLRQDRYRECYAGLLCTIDIRSDPHAVYRTLADLDPPAVDFLLPHATWDTPPSGQAVARPRTPTGWRRSSAIGRLTAGGYRLASSTRSSRPPGAAPAEPSRSGSKPANCWSSRPTARSNRPTRSRSPSTAPRRPGLACSPIRWTRPPPIRPSGPGSRAWPVVSETCRQCPVVTSCGGGLYAHRYRSETGFDNPSVYCADLKQIITHIRADLRPAAPAAASPRSARSPHTLTGAQFDSLAAGFGDAAAVRELVGGQRTQPARPSSNCSGGGPIPPSTRNSWPAGISSPRWSGRTPTPPPCACAPVHAHLGRSLRGRHPAGFYALLPKEAPHLAAIAASAAVRSGLPAEIQVPVLDGYACLPTLGRLRVGPSRPRSPSRSPKADSTPAPATASGACGWPTRNPITTGSRCDCCARVRSRSRSKTPTPTETPTSGRPRTGCPPMTWIAGNGSSQRRGRSSSAPSPATCPASRSGCRPSCPWPAASPAGTSAPPPGRVRRGRGGPPGRRRHSRAAHPARVPARQAGRGP